MNKGLTERALIERFFRECGASRNDVTVGVGDDAALINLPPGMQLVAKTDTLVSGVHFLPNFPAGTSGVPVGRTYRIVTRSSPRCSSWSNWIGW